MRKTFIILSLTISYALHTNAQTKAMTLERCREMALEYNRQAADSRITTQIAQQAVRQYRANFFPDISLAGGLLYSTSSKTLFDVPTSQLGQMAGAMLGTPIDIPDLKLDWEFGWLWHGGIQLKQPLFMGGKITAAHKIAKHSLTMAKQNERLTDIEIIEQADDAFINMVRARELRTVAQKYFDLLTELEHNVQSAVDLGMKMPADLLRVQVKKNEVELQMRRADNAMRLAKMNLNHVTGQPLDTEVDVVYAIDFGMSYTETENPIQTGDTASSNPNHQSTGEQAERPEFLILQEQLEIANQQVRVARAEALPQLALLATYGYTNGLKIAGHKVFDGADFMGGITLNIPIYHFGERCAKIKQAKLKAKQAQNALDNVNEQLSLALAKARNEADEALLEAKLSARSLTQAETSLETTRHQYENGMTPLSDLLDAQALWQKAYQTKIDAHCALHIAATALQKALGTLR